MLRPPPHPGDPAARTERLLARVRVATLTAVHAAGLAGQVRWQRPDLSTGPAPAREEEAQ